EGAAVAMRIVEDADQVDDHIRLAEVLAQHGWVVAVGFHELQAGNDEQVAVAFAVAGQHPDGYVLLAEGAGDMPPDEAGPTKNADSSLAHGCLLLLMLVRAGKSFQLSDPQRPWKG